jgi:hypothetical protein
MKRIVRAWIGVGIPAILIFADRLEAQRFQPLEVECPSNRVVSTCGTSPVMVTFPVPKATGDCASNAVVTCTPPSGSLFPLGVNTVLCTATNGCRERTNCLFTVTVARDVTLPVIQCPSNLSVVACSASGTVVNYPMPTATDNPDTNVAVTCTPASGSLFPAGTTTVTCTATDDCTNRSACTFLVHVTRDTTPPVITCPSNIVFNCLCPGQVINLDFFQTTATDNLDPDPTVVCDPPSLVSSPGVHVVTCTATDDCGNSNRCQFTVTFNYDTIPPVISCPTNLIVWSCSNSAVVKYSVSATDTCDANVDLVCTPPSGALFPVGTTPVVCTATDNCTNRSTCTFTVTVRPPLFYQGLCHSSMGLASLNFDDAGRLSVSGLGASGEDGVRINLGESHGLAFSYRNASGPQDSDLEVQILGRNTLGQEFQAVRMMHHFENGKVYVTPSFASYEVKLLLRGEIVYLRSGVSGPAPPICWFEVNEVCVPTVHVPDFLYIEGCWYYITPECAEPTEFGPVLADTMVITPEIPGPQVTSVTVVQFIGRNHPGITLEDEWLLMFGGPGRMAQAHKALGEAHLVARGDRLTVDALGSQAGEGVAIDFTAPGAPPLLPQRGYAVSLEPLSMDAGAEFEIAAYARLNGEPTALLASLALRKISPTEVELRPRCILIWYIVRVEIHNDGQNVGGVTLPVGVPVATLTAGAAGMPRLTGVTKLPAMPAAFALSFDVPGTFTLPDGTPLTGDEVRVVAFSPTETTAELSRLQITSVGVPSMTLTRETPSEELWMMCPTNMTVWTCATNPIAVTFPPPLVAGGMCSNAPTVTCVPPAGSLFPVGESLVTCTATDSCTNRGVCQFRVSVRVDTNAPTIACPTNLTVITCTNFAVVNYDVSVVDDCDTNVTLVCTPPSGSMFPLGANTVECVARDDCGNTVRCRFDVNVRRPQVVIAAGVGSLMFSWPEGGILEEADNVDGPWRPVAEARSPYRVNTAGGQKFFRLAVFFGFKETLSFCPSIEVTNPRLTDTPSRMHYASIHALEEFEEYEDVSPDPMTFTYPPRVPSYDPRPGAGYSWNSAVGRRLLLEIGDVGDDPEGAASHPSGSVEQQILLEVATPTCVTPDYYVEADDRNFTGWPEVNGVPTATFQAPKNAFATKAEAEAFLLKVHAEQPFFLPFSHPDVKLGQGWYYNSGKLHRACDYSRSGVEENEDPTFLVTSAGSGVVVATDWDGNGGNYVAVEHTAPGGQKLMFVYLHLRNGKSHDVAKARSSTSTDEKYVKYRAFANNFPDHLSWGTESHTIMVQVGDPISVGTPIAWAGNTGAGGAGNGLNDDGSPKNWKGNVHLHVYVAVPHPTVQNAWVWVDPYGVYQEVETGCYDLLKDTKFSRLYAPFYPTFHGVPYEVFKFYWGYYPDMGMKLRTLSIHRDGDSLLASGSFETGIPGGWYLHTYKTIDNFQDFADEHYAHGYIMRETTVEKTLGGQPRYSAIWRPLEPGESIEHRAQLTDAQWGDLWQDRVVQDQWRLEDYFGYSVAGVNYQSVLVTSHEGRPFLYSGLLTSSEFDQTIDEYKSDGFLPVSFNVASRASGLRFSGIFRDLPGCWKVAWGLTPSGYQSYVTQQIQLGYRVWRVQGYANSGRYGVVLYDPTGPCQ